MTKPIELITHPPFNPIHDGLYNPSELLKNFDPDNPLSLTATIDFQNYIYFLQQGRTTISDPYAAMMEAMHDTSIGRGLNAFLKSEMQSGRRPVAIMGGHREPRGSEIYCKVARIAQLLSESGFIVVSGGGPGCMEATHLGALYAGRSTESLNDAIKRLADGPFAEVPKNLTEVLRKGTPWEINEDIVRELHAWRLPAWEIAQELKDQITPLNCSLAVPTWHYGHEPFTPFATHVAKYFLNSIREDVLLALASCGIVYSEGRGGTIQEVFQDAAQIYYRDDNAPITSMVFLDSQFWTLPEIPDGKVHMPVMDLLQQLFVVSNNMTEEEYKRYVRLVDDAEEVVKIIIENAPSTVQTLQKLAKINISNIDPELMAKRAATFVNKKRK
ncbi:LOG family protein [Bacillus wiedmannii]|uniref:LOG family protein n=1 Tax=Bacillus wiedmannii TaxID=1890302 RepID=UPI003F9388CF